jgi:hypothetical protein
MKGIWFRVLVMVGWLVGWLFHTLNYGLDRALRDRIYAIDS